MMKCGVALSALVLVLASSAQAGPSEAMAFAIGMCSAQPDPQARLKCYDDIAAKLKAGEPVGPQASSAPATPAPVYTPPPPAASAYTPPPVAAPPAAAQPAAPPPAQNFGKAEPSGKSGTAWYNPGTWFGSDSSEASSGATQTAAQFGAEAIPERTKPGEPAKPEPLDRITAKVTGYSFAANGRFTVTLDNGQMWKQLDGDTGTPHFDKNGGDSVTISRGFLGSYNLVVEGHNAMFKVRRIE